jgi:hypothetical protein
MRIKFREACLTCPMFLTTAEFLPQHRTQRQQTLELITAAEARGQTRLLSVSRSDGFGGAFGRWW